MVADHGITIDEQVRWLGEQAASLLSTKQWMRFEGQWVPDPRWESRREDSSMLLAIENTLRAVQVSAVSPPSASPADSPLGPNGSGGFYRGD
jgi:hypothetical protein